MRRKIILLCSTLALIAWVSGLDFDPNPDLVVYDHEAVHNFGRAVAVCDINNDSNLDLIVGTGQGNLTVYVYYGGPLDKTPDLTITPPTIGGYNPDDFGSRLLCAGDVNDDGVYDLAVSDPTNARNRAFIYLGGASFDGDPDVNLTDYTSYNNFGGSLSTGDLNNDGIDDLVVGASTEKVVFVYYGGGSFDGTADIVFSESLSSSFGLSVSAEGDLNDDGITDLAVGSYPGEIYVYYGGGSFDNTSDVDILNLENGAGYDVSSAGDLSGDTEADLVVSGGSNTYIFFGGRDFDNTTDINISGVTTASTYALVSGPDMNNDGFSDLAVGASGGRVHIIYGGTLLDNASDVNLTRSGVNNFGISLASGDLNEDGVDDLVVGDGSWIFGGEKNRAFVYYGATSPLTREVHDIWGRLNTPQQTIVTLQGKLTNSTTGDAITNASMLVTITNSTGSQVWQDTFNNILNSGVFNIPLGASQQLRLIKDRVYNMKVEVDLNAASFSTADATFGDGNPSGDVIKFTA